MRKYFLSAILICSGIEVKAQNSTTNCYGYGSTVQCRTQPDPGIEQQRSMNQAFSNLGAAIAERRERKKQERAAMDAAATQAAIVAAIKFALDSDKAIESPPPADEQPVRLICTINGSPTSLSLYEKNNRVDSSSGGITRTRMATFSTESIHWNSPLIRSTLSRADGSYIGYGDIPEVQGQKITGTCALATQRRF